MLHFASVMIAALLIASPLLAAGGGGGSGGGGADTVMSGKAFNPDAVAGRKAIDMKDWDQAIALFLKVVAKDDQDADAFNWLGYAYRNQGNYEQSFAHYTRALAIQPSHRGAHEYIGEAYLKVGNLAKAEEHLKRLDTICLFGCAEYTELKGKIAAYKAAKPS